MIWTEHHIVAKAFCFIVLIVLIVLIRQSCTMRRAESVRIEGNPLAKIRAQQSLAAVKSTAHIHVEDPSTHEASKLKVDYLAEAAPIRPQQLQQILDKLNTFERNEDFVDYLEFQKSPYLFSSDSLMKILLTTTSIKTRLAVIDMLGPRLTDPKHRMEDFLNLFRFAEEKCRVEEVLKARSATIMSQMFRTTPHSRNNTIGNSRVGKGRGGINNRRSSRSRYASAETQSSGYNFEYDTDDQDDRARSAVYPAGIAEESPADMYDASEENALPDSSSSRNLHSKIDESSQGSNLFTSQDSSSKKSEPVQTQLTSATRLSTTVTVEDVNLTPPTPRTTTTTTTAAAPPPVPSVQTPSLNLAESSNRGPVAPLNAESSIKTAANSEAMTNSVKNINASLAKINANENTIVPSTTASEEDEIISSILNQNRPFSDSVHRPMSLLTTPVNPPTGELPDGQKMKMTPNCPGLVVKIRPTPSASEPHVGVIKSGQEIEVFSQRENGFYRLADGRGYINKNTLGVSWTIESSANRNSVTAGDPNVHTHLSLSRLKQLNIKPRHQGVLLKLSDWLKEWRPRYFAIYGTRLFICSDPNPVDTEQPKVEIDFSNYSPNLSLVIATSFDRVKNGYVLELKMTKIKDRPKGLNLRSILSEDSKARDDLNLWMDAILDIQKIAHKERDDINSSSVRAIKSVDSDDPTSPIDKLRSVSSGIATSASAALGFLRKTSSNNVKSTDK